LLHRVGWGAVMKLASLFFGVALLVVLLACSSEGRITSKSNQLWDCLEGNPGFHERLKSTTGNPRWMWDGRDYLVNVMQDFVDPPIEITDAERSERLIQAEETLDGWITTCETIKTIE